MYQSSKRKIFIGHANTLHDPSITIIEGNKIYAEAIERHMQCKRAIESERLWYSWRSIKTALSHLEIMPVKDAEIIWGSPWNVNKYIEHKPGFDPVKFFQPKHPRSGYELLLSLLMLEQLTVNQVKNTINNLPPHFFPPSPKLNSRNITFLDPIQFDHHLMHAANAVYTSPFEECLCLIVDGFGESTSIDVFHFHDNQFDSVMPTETKYKQGFSKLSLGFLYGLITEYCGFNMWEGEEWKVMGLAAYGKFNPDIYQYFNDNITINVFKIDSSLSPDSLRDYLESIGAGIRKFGDSDVLKAADLANSFQKWFEDTLIKLVQTASQTGLSKNLAYGGGCALNSSANGKILAHSSFENLHIPSAPADDGNSLGVALYQKHFLNKEKREIKTGSPYLGSWMDTAKLEKILEFKKIPFEKINDDKKLCSIVAELIASKNIIGWVQGRAEFGPRALGNRSIIADPRPQDMKDRINKRIKFREDYRPLAPSILHEFGPEYFENYQESPYMERTLVFKKEVRKKVPAVVHEDGTGRLQTVKEEWNPLYYQLIRTFYQKTGIPLLLNTSLNVMGKPIVHTVEDALTVFYTTGMDYLIIGHYLIGYLNRSL